MKTGRSSFPTTRWTLILDLQEGSEPQRQRALADLCSTYWYPLYAYARHRGQSPEDAQDLTQTFLAELIRGGRFERADSDKGKLRSYLLASMNRFLAKDWHRKSAQKRGGGIQDLSIDQEFAESRIAVDLVDGATPEKLFDQRWAKTLLDSVDKTLREEYLARGRGDHFEALHGYLFWNSGDPPYSEVSETLNLSEAAVRQAVVRMRKRFGTILRENISFTVESPDDIDEEIRELFAAFRADH